MYFCLLSLLSNFKIMYLLVLEALQWRGRWLEMWGGRKRGKEGESGGEGGRGMRKGERDRLLLKY